MNFRGWVAKLSDLFKSRPLEIVLLAGLFLRLIGIERRSLSYDDTFSIFLAQRSLSEILSGTAVDTMPPLYYFLLHYWMKISNQVWFIRLLSVLFSLAAVYLVYRLGEVWLGRSAAIWGAGLAAVSPLMIYHGQDVRMYALLVTSQLGYFWYFTRIWKTDTETIRSTWPAWLGLIICGAAAMYSHNVAVFALAAPDLFLLLHRQWKKLFRIVTGQVFIGLVALPWLLMIPSQIAKVQRAWTLPTPGVVEILQALIMLVSSLPLSFWLMAIALLIALQAIVVIAIELLRIIKILPDCRDGVEFFLYLFLLPPVGLFLVSYLVKPMFVSRAFLISSLAFDLLAGFVIVRGWKRGIGKFLAGGILLAALISLPTHYRYQEFPRSPYREAVMYLANRLQPGEVIIHETKLSYFPSAFYAPDLPQVFLADQPGSPNDTFEPGSQAAMQIFPLADLDTASKGSHGVYFVTFRQTFTEYQEMGLAEHPNVTWLNEHFHQANHISFSDLEVYYYLR